MSHCLWKARGWPLARALRVPKWLVVAHAPSSLLMKPITGAGRLSALASLVLFAGNLVANPLGSAFTYQGRLDAGGSPANGNYDLQFAVFDASTGGSQLGSSLTNAATVVSNGLFTVPLDFGAGVFTGASRWLAIGVRTNGGDAFVPLSPRQSILPVPYALMASSTSNLVGTLPASKLSGTLPSSQLAGTYSNAVTFSAAAGSFSGSFSGNGAGLTNLTVPAANLTGIIPLAQLPTAVLTNNQSGVSLTGSFSGNGGGLTNLPGRLTWQVVTGTSQQAQPNAGYIASSASLVTITLPMSPAIGDVVRVAGAGAGGWKIAQNAGQSVIAANLGVFGATWIPRASSLNWRCIASSADGTRLVAGVDGGPIYTSTDSVRTGPHVPVSRSGTQSRRHPMAPSWSPGSITGRSPPRPILAQTGLHARSSGNGTRSRSHPMAPSWSRWP